MLLSICVPTYNRSNELERLLITIPINNNIEVVICDDGSTDNTKEIIDKYQKQHSIKYIYQVNSGRATALRVAIEHASAKYAILMDSDDYFVDGWYQIVLDGINALDQYNIDDNVRSLVFGVIITRAGKNSANLPSNGLSNLIKFRVESSNYKDYKELVDTSVLKESLYQVAPSIRRVPTGLLWLRVAERTKCLCVERPIAFKEYLQGGMSDSILALKTQNALPMVELNELLVKSDSYQSFAYRIRSVLLWGRYYHHIIINKPTIRHVWQYISLILSYPIYMVDRIRLYARSSKT